MISFAGRDHGLPGFCCYYKKYQDDGIDCSRGWENKYNDFTEDSWNQLKEIYANPNDIDLFTGGLGQSPFNGGLTGRVFNEMKGKVIILFV